MKKYKYRVVYFEKQRLAKNGDAVWPAEGQDLETDINGKTWWIVENESGDQP